MANSRKLRRAPDPSNLLEYLSALLLQHVPPGSHVSLGLSGGLDSCVLLDLLVKVKADTGLQLSAIHVNHQISPNADAWADFCSLLCASVDVPLTIVKVDVPRDSGLGLEAAARQVRYKALLDNTSGKLLLAHHQDDQVETLMLQLLRGAGVEGLAAMPESGSQVSVDVLRPLLKISRDQLERWAQANALRWIDDESNDDQHYDRNFIRHTVFPAIERRFPAYRSTFARVAENQADAMRLLAQIAVEDATVAICGEKLDLTWMKTQTAERSMNLLRWWIDSKTGVKPSQAWLSNGVHQLLNAKANAQVQCSFGRFVLRRYRSWAYITDTQSMLPYHIEWKGESDLLLPDGSRLILKRSQMGGISPTVVDRGVTVTNRAGAENDWELKFCMSKKQSTRSMKNLWQEAGTPPWERDAMPLIWSDDVLICVPRMGIASHVQVELGYGVEWVQ